MSDGMGVADLLLMEDGEPNFENDRLLAALKEAGISPNLLTPMQLARLRQDMIMDPTPFDDAGSLMEMLRGMGGFENAITPDKNEPIAGEVAPPDLPFISDIKCLGEATTDNLHPECADGFEPEHTKHEPLTAAFMDAMRKKKPL